VLPRDQVGEVTSLPTPELRTGDWTRHGDGVLLGDAVAESLLGQVAAQARAAAEAQGYAVGWAQGRRQAEEEAAAAARESAQRAAEAEARREAEHQAALAALAQAAADVRAVLDRLTARVEEQATTLAWELTETLVGREVQVAPSADVITRVLQASPAGALATVRLHPEHVEADAVQMLREAGLTVVADPGLGRGDALVECDGSVADLRISEALERVRQVLA
jgi:flagellar assembly protein FliH